MRQPDGMVRSAAGRPLSGMALARSDARRWPAGGIADLAVDQALARAGPPGVGRGWCAPYRWRRRGMETRGMFAGRDPPVSAEVVHASERTRITRLFLPDRTVIRKEPLGRDAQRRLRQELAMLERLRGIPGVVQLVEEPRFPGSLSLVDVAGASLAGMATPVDADVLIRLGSALARAVAGVHSRLVMHRDISPANIVISPDGDP